MREYELIVVFDLSVAEAGGNDAAPDLVTTFVEARKGKILKHDHWGRRRMAYPINHSLDADYVVSRVEMDPDDVTPLEAALRIDERVFRHLIVRADELPAPPPPREPRRMPGEGAEPGAAPEGMPEAAAAPEAAATDSEPAPDIAEPAAASSEAASAASTEAAESAVEAPSPVAVPAEATDETVEPVVTPDPAAGATPPAASEAGEPPAPPPDVETPVTEAPAAAVESPATEAEPDSEAGTEDELAPQEGKDTSA